MTAMHMAHLMSFHIHCLYWGSQISIVKYKVLKIQLQFLLVQLSNGPVHNSQGYTSWQDPAHQEIDHPVFKPGHHIGFSAQSP